MRVAVSGSTGRLGSAIVRRLEAEAGWSAIPWTRADVDLDDAAATAATSLDRDAPDLVIHCAAWTDVDGCALEPDVAARRNGVATGAIAEAAAARGIALLAISTNEVFDGRRTDGVAYAPGEPVAPANPYGRSKALGEELATRAYASAVAPLWIVRTAWLFGPPGTDFPAKIARAARTALEAGEPLKLVADEVGNPTWCVDLAAAVVALVGDPSSAGMHHVVNAGHASRAEWARAVLQRLGIEVPTVDVSLDTWPRPSQPPRRAVLEPTPLPTIGRLRPWPDAMAEDLATRPELRVAAEARR